jgi:hypothetical protein
VTWPAINHAQETDNGAVQSTGPLPDSGMPQKTQRLGDLSMCSVHCYTEQLSSRERSAHPPNRRPTQGRCWVTQECRRAANVAPAMLRLSMVLGGVGCCCSDQNRSKERKEEPLTK